MTDEKMNEDKKGEVFEGPESVPGAEAPADDTQEGKETQKDDLESLLEAMKSDGDWDLPARSKLAQLKKTPEEWQKMVREARDRSDASKKVLASKNDHLTILKYDGQPEHFSEQQADDLGDDIASDGKCSDCENEYAPGEYDYEGEDAPAAEEAPAMVDVDEDDEDAAEDLDDTKESDYYLDVPAGPAEDDAGAGDVGGSNDAVKDADDAMEDVDDAMEDVDDAMEDDAGAGDVGGSDDSMEDADDSDYAEDSDDDDSTEDSDDDDSMEDSDDAEHAEDGNGAASGAVDEQDDDQRDVAMALAEGAITNTGEVYGDNVQDMED